MIAVPVVGRVGDSHHLLRELGKLEGHISDTARGSSLVELVMTPSMREKFAGKLTWLDKKRKNPALPEVRLHARIIPATRIRP